ncbi:hypothetical protein Tco_1229015 [Tanacetum coccineum]
MDLDSSEDDPVIVIDESEEDDKEDKAENFHATSNVETKDTSVSKPPSPRNWLPGDLKEIPTKLEEFTKTVTSLTSQVAELKTLQWELPAKFLLLPTKVETIQAKLKTLDALPSLVNKVTDALNQFAQAIASALMKTKDASVFSAGQAGTQPAEGEKNTDQATISQLFQRRATKDVNLTKQQSTPTSQITTTTTSTTSLQSPLIFSPPKSSSQTEGEHIKKEGKTAMSPKDAEEESSDSESDDTIDLTGSRIKSSRMKKLNKFDFITEDGDQVEVRKEELVDLLGPDVVSKYYNDKLKYDKYCDKMLNKRAESRTINCDVLTRKGPNTLKVYIEDDTSKIIPNFKASDLHLGEWREVVKACPDIKGKGRTTIYEQIQAIMDYLHKIEEELGIELDKPLSEQDPLDKLNDLTKKKRKHVDDIHDFFKANKGSSHQFNMKIIQLDFVTIEDFRDFLNEMMYIVQEIFFRLHQGPRIDDHARTFNALLLVVIDKRNLNPLKQMRPIEQLRQ